MELAMTVKFRTFAVSILIAAIAGCAASPPPNPTQVQVSFNLPPRDQTAPAKHITRGAVSGTPQHVGFFYSVNPDCSSDGLVQLQLKAAAEHGSVSFAKADGYSSFPLGSPSHECNRNKSPGVEVVYTSAKDFVGVDQFTVQGVGPHGAYLETDYTVKVLAPSTN
jgi:hypothetical protein